LNTFKNELVNKVYEEIEKFLTATLDSKLTIYSANGFIVSINGILTKLDEEIESTIKENKTFEKNNWNLWMCFKSKNKRYIFNY